jgi:type IV pilus assembly protein PilV
MNMSKRQQEKGYSLLEVLIALVILAIGLLGLAGLQMQGLKGNHGSHLRSQATFLAADILDRMQANRDQALVYNIALGSVPSMGGIVEQDLSAWKDALNATLPSCDGSVNSTRPVVGEPVHVSVIIRWEDVNENGSFTSFRTDTRL